MDHSYHLVRSAFVTAVLLLGSNAEAAPNRVFRHVPTDKFGPAISPIAGNAAAAIGQSPASSGCGTIVDLQRGTALSSRARQLGCAVGSSHERDFGMVSAMTQPLGHAMRQSVGRPVGYSPATIESPSRSSRFDSFGTANSSGARLNNRQANSGGRLHLPESSDAVADYFAVRHADFGVGGPGHTGITNSTLQGVGAGTYSPTKIGSGNYVASNYAGTLVVNTSGLGGGSMLSAGAVFTQASGSSQAGTLILSGNPGATSFWNAHATVPEPSTFALFAIAGISLLSARRRVVR